MTPATTARRPNRTSRSKDGTGTSPNLQSRQFQRVLRRATSHLISFRKDREGEYVQGQDACSLKNRETQYSEADRQEQKGGAGEERPLLWRSPRCCKNRRMFFCFIQMCSRFKAVVSLCPDIDPRHAILGLNASVDVETSFNSTTICSAE